MRTRSYLARFVLQGHQRSPNQEVKSAPYSNRARGGHAKAVRLIMKSRPILVACLAKVVVDALRALVPAASYRRRLAVVAHNPIVYLGTLKKGVCAQCKVCKRISTPTEASSAKSGDADVGDGVLDPDPMLYIYILY